MLVMETQRGRRDATTPFFKELPAVNGNGRRYAGYNIKDILSRGGDWYFIDHYAKL
jgi:hypothetical protein